MGKNVSIRVRVGKNARIEAPNFKKHALARGSRRIYLFVSARLALWKDAKRREGGGRGANQRRTLIRKKVGGGGGIKVVDGFFVSRSGHRRRGKKTEPENRHRWKPGPTPTFPATKRRPTPNQRGRNTHITSSWLWMEIRVPFPK